MLKTFILMFLHKAAYSHTCAVMLTTITSITFCKRVNHWQDFSFSVSQLTINIQTLHKNLKKDVFLPSISSAIYWYESLKHKNAFSAMMLFLTRSIILYKNNPLHALSCLNKTKKVEEKEQSILNLMIKMKYGVISSEKLRKKNCWKCIKQFPHNEVQYFTIHFLHWNHKIRY